MRWILGVTALLLGTIAIVGVVAQSDSEREVRVRAKRLADGRTEFEVQQRNQDGGWSDSLFATNPKLSSDPTIDRWYRSSPVALIPWPDVAMELEETDTADGRPQREEDKSTWSPLGDTDGEIAVRYSVSLDPITSEYTTVVKKLVATDEFGIDYIRLAVGCQDGKLELSLYDSSEWLVYTNSTEDITLRIPGQPVISETWAYLSGGEFGVNGYSPQNDLALIQDLREADTVFVRFGDGDVRELDVTGLFDTPAQANIDRCGTY